MRKLYLVPGLLILFAGNVGLAAAQDAEESIVVTGCLAQEEDGEEVEYLLENVAGELAAASEIEVIPGEGVALSDHVGHTVEVTGVVVADDDEDEAGEAEQEADEEAEATEVHIRATGLSHVAASCAEGGR
jgi:tRNA A37 methylthiotransferase MiaB